jgi:Mrp family chromosome partitioning ATPase
MALEDYLKVVIRWWWLLVLSTFVAAASSYVSVSRVPRIYQATTTVIVGQSINRSNPTFQDFAIGQQLAQTYVNMVRRQPILQGAAEALGLDYVPWSGNISAVIVPGTQLVEISVRDTSPRQAQALADEIAHQLILQTPDNPASNQRRRAFVEEQLQSLERNIAATEEEIEDQQVRLDTANSARAIQQYQSNIAALQQRLGSYQSSYASLLQSVDGGANYISVIQYALLPVDPISPKARETVMLAAAIGLSLATGGALLIELLDNTVRTSDDIMKLVQLPTLGTISSIQGQQNGDRLPSAYMPQSAVAESFRALRTSIQYCAVNRQLRTLVLTSPAPAEGKSLVLANLAVVMAQSGLSVLLVDADMRRPVQHKMFALNNDLGLSNGLLESEVDLATYTHLLDSDVLTELLSVGEAGTEAKRTFTLGHGRLRVMTAGPVPPNPADLLGSQRMRDLVQQLVGEADIVLFDTPPTLAVTDAVALASAVDGVLIVADAGRSKRSALRQAAERLKQVDANLVGVILNRASPGESGYYTYQYHSQDQRPKRSGIVARLRGGRLAKPVIVPIQKMVAKTSGEDRSNGHSKPPIAAAEEATAETLGHQNRSDTERRDLLSGEGIPSRPATPTSPKQGL